MNVAAVSRPAGASTLSGPELASFMTVGTRVLRGQDWAWGFEDGNPPGPGTVVKEVNSYGRVMVKWDAGRIKNYSMGYKGKYDLTLLQPPPTTDVCAGDHALCGPNAVCSNTHGSFSCACNEGYQKPPGVTIADARNPCQDIDECEGDSSTCGPNALCSNTNGSFSCACNEGYQKPPGVTITDATNPCQDIDECARDSSTCGPNALCSNTNGSFSCACNEGYQKPPGVTITNAANPCQDIDECARDSYTCGPNALCSNTNGGFSCACNEGYQKPPGVTITDATNPCQDVDLLFVNINLSWREALQYCSQRSSRLVHILNGTIQTRVTQLLSSLPAKIRPVPTAWA
ncbi:adhesion G protein-coupled receptor E1-like [Sardina pilchardus]|uniref:adhesion G protein-coupled receptor E1-like n=1 Tax=Sardina pilchardus TaxID=27697 RepID=UPI002E11317B